MEQSSMEISIQPIPPADTTDEEAAMSFLQMISNVKEPKQEEGEPKAKKAKKGAKKSDVPRMCSPVPDSSVYVNNLGRFKWKQALIDCLELHGGPCPALDFYTLVFQRIPDICAKSGYPEQEVKRCIRHTIAEDVRDRADSTPFTKTGDGKSVIYGLTADWKDRTNVSKDRPKHVERKRWCWAEKLVPIVETATTPMTVFEIAQALKEKFRATEIGKMDTKALSSLIKHFLKKYVQDEHSFICRVSTGRYASRHSQIEHQTDANSPYHSQDSSHEVEDAAAFSAKSEDERPSSPIVREAVLRTFLEQNRPMKPRELLDCLLAEDTCTGLTTRQLSSAIKKDIKERGFDSEFCHLPSGLFCLRSSLDYFGGSMEPDAGGDDGTPLSAEAPTLPPTTGDFLDQSFYSEYSVEGNWDTYGGYYCQPEQTEEELGQEWEEFVVVEEDEDFEPNPQSSIPPLGDSIDSHDDEISAPLVIPNQEELLPPKKRKRCVDEEPNGVTETF